MREDNQFDRLKKNRQLDQEEQEIWEDDLEVYDDLSPEEVKLEVDEAPPDVKVKEKEEPKESFFRKRPNMLVRAVIAAALLLLTVLVFQNPLNAKLDQLAKNVLDRDTDFAMVRDWVESNVGKGNPTILPAFTPPGNLDSNQATPVETKPTIPAFESPVNGEIIAPFSDKNPGIVVKTNGKIPVKAAADGEVVKLGKVDDWENVVVIRHVDGSETWYQGMEDIRVTLNQKVKQGENIGMTSMQDGSYLVSIYYYKDQELRDPAEVIHIEP